MLAYERAAGGERAACGGVIEWTPEGDRKGTKVLSMHMMVCSEWAGATLPSRVAPQKFCIIMLLSQHVFCRDGSIFVSPFQAYGQVRQSLSMYIDSHYRRLEKRRKQWKTIASI